MAHVALFAFPEEGHINPMLQLALHLASRGAYVTLINTEPAHHKMHPRFEHLQQRYHNLHFACIPDGLPAHQLSLTPNVFISGFSIQGAPTSAAMPTLLRSLENQGPALEQLLSDLNGSLDLPPLCGFICDAFLPWAALVARKLQLSWMVFWTSSATRLYLTVKALDDEAMGTEQDKSVVIIPGLPPMSTNVAGLSSLQNPQRLQSRLKAIKEADCILLNTFDDIEAEAIRNLSLKLPIRALGPVCLSAGTDDDPERALTNDDECLSWLDKQVAHSVLYISFGSKALLQGKPLEQLALGIEASNKPFLWVLRSSKDDLPEGFLERTEERSKIMSWVPQKKVLGHSAVGGFLTHCGWNSVLEALVEGVPMICWPTFADQPTNRILVEHKWRIGKGIQGGEVDVDDLRQVIQDVMGDEGIRHQAFLLGLSAKSALREGGISHKNLVALLATMEQLRVDHI